MKVLRQTGILIVLKNRVPLSAILLVIVLLPAGCATSGSQDLGLFGDSESIDTRPSAGMKDRDLSLHAEPFSGGGSSPANYDHVASRWSADSGSDPYTQVQQGSGSPVELTPDGVFAGHSFVPPRIRLGRPIPLAAEAPSRGSGELEQRTPWPRPGNSPLFNEPTGGWQGVPAEPQPAMPPDGQLNPSASAQSSPQSSQVTGTTVSFEPAESEGSPLPEQLVDPAQPVPGQAAAGEVPAPAAPPEPTMLDRLRRGLTVPLDENADRFKRQMRRWPDPFGLLRDRDDVPAPDAATQTADATLAPTMGDSAAPESQLPADPSAGDSSVHTDVLQILISQLEQQLADWPRDNAGQPEQESDWRRRQSDLRMLYLIDGRQAEAVRIIEGLPAEEQEFWQSLMLAVSDFRSASGSASRADELNSALEHLRDAGRRLQPLSTLSLRRVMFCDRIDGFGQVVPWPTADFKPGQRVLIYAEIRNFRSELTDAGVYRSEFSAMLDFLRSEDDEILETVRLPSIVDESVSERTDYFHAYELTVPALSGTYRVRLRLKDENSSQTAETLLEFRVL